MPSPIPDAYSQYTAFTTSAGNIAPGPCVLGRVIVVTDVTGSILIDDNVGAATGTRVFASAANPTAGTVIGPLGIRTKHGAYCSAGSGGSFIVTWQ